MGRGGERWGGQGGGRRPSVVRDVVVLPGLFWNECYTTRLVSSFVSVRARERARACAVCVCVFAFIQVCPVFDSGG
jgi:hypothetical protein